MRFYFLVVLLVGIVQWSLTQECEPDPGPPIFYDDFDSGANPGLSLPGGSTTFVYESVEDGGYVVSNTTNLITGFWHDGEDYTLGDVLGYALLYNGTDGPEQFYERTFEDLCPNTDYIFSAYLTNLAVPTACIGDAIKPDVRFSAFEPGEVASFATVTTGEIFWDSFLTWEIYYFRFRTGPEQTTVLIRMTNNNFQGSCGNDLGIDDVSLRLCNPPAEQAFEICDLPGGNITVGDNTYTEPGTYLDRLPIPATCNDTLMTTVLTGDTRRQPTIQYVFCQGESVEVFGQIFTSSFSFVDTLPGPMPDCPLFQPYQIIEQAPPVVFQDIPICNGQAITVGSNAYTDPGTYTDTLSTLQGCDSIVITTITTDGIAIEVSPHTAMIAEGQEVSITSTVSISDSFQLSWQPAADFSCTDCLDPVLTPSNPEIYRVTATDIPSGCSATAAIEVSFSACENVYLPNAFSPNQDGVNDRLELFATDCFTRIISWRIYNRWGQVVYEVNDRPLDISFRGWNGRVNDEFASQGVFSYHLVLERVGGTRKEMIGEVVVVR